MFRLGPAEVATTRVLLPYALSSHAASAAASRGWGQSDRHCSVRARAARLVRRAFDDALSQAGGSLPAWLVLLNLKIRLTVTQREVAEAVGIREATLTHHLNAMETDGLLTRRRDHNNRRIHVVELTDAGGGGLPATPRRRGRFRPAPASRHHRRGASQPRRSARPARR